MAKSKSFTPKTIRFPDGRRVTFTQAAHPERVRKRAAKKAAGVNSP